MKKKPAARAVDPKPCESCGHCPTCGHSPREVVKHVPVPMPYPVPAPQPVYPWGRYPTYRPYWQVDSPTYVGGGYGAGGTYVNGVNVSDNTSIAAQPAGMLMNCN